MVWKFLILGFFLGLTIGYVIACLMAARSRDADFQDYICSLEEKGNDNEKS